MGTTTSEALTAGAEALAACPPAPPWRRLVARVLDSLTVLFGLWALVVLHVLWFMEALSTHLRPEPWGRAFAPTLTFALLFVLYETVFVLRNNGQTPGKDLCHLRVVSASGPVTLRRSVVRAVVASSLWLVPPTWLGGALVVIAGGTALLGRQARSVPDLIAGTRVGSYDRNREDPTAPPRPPWSRPRWPDPPGFEEHR